MKSGHQHAIIVTRPQAFITQPIVLKELWTRQNTVSLIKPGSIFHPTNSRSPVSTWLNCSAWKQPHENPSDSEGAIVTIDTGSTGGMQWNWSSATTMLLQYCALPVRRAVARHCICLPL